MKDLIGETQIERAVDILFREGYRFAATDPCDCEPCRKAARITVRQMIRAALKSLPDTTGGAG